MTQLQRIALIGFGEVGQILAHDLLQLGFCELVAWDRLFIDTTRQLRYAAEHNQVRLAGSNTEAIRGAAIIISAVTAAQCIVAAQTAASAIESGAYFLDLNSVAPATKQAAAAIINQAGGRYIEAAVMSPIAPRRIATPMLFGGCFAELFLPHAHELGFKGASVCSDQIGMASATKMCRSIVVKGLESLVIESMLAARGYDVETLVSESLQDFFSGLSRLETVQYLISRSVQHGVRRAEEMHEVCATLRGVEVEPHMATAIATRQQLAASLKQASDLLC
jgi:3-hydroxyisobutyrate dehydrogenase-like beta-hydroxyacid dehydrogenase